MKITLQNISKAFGGKDIFNNFSLDIDSGCRLCVCGPNGCGKSTLIRIIAGAEQPDSGQIFLPKNSRIGYVEQTLDQDALGTPLLEWVLDVLPDWHDFWEEWEKAVQNGDSDALMRLSAHQTELEAVYGYNPEHKARAVLSGLGFSDERLHLPLAQLSGGWRERAKLSRVLVAGADILLLDEPTNHLDIEAVEWLESFLKEYQGVLVFVAHDRVFMDRVGTHILYVGAARPVFRKATFTQFVALQEALEEQREREAKRLNEELEHKMDFVRRFSAKATKARQAASRQKMARKLQKELEEFRPEIKRRELSFRWPEAPKSDKTVLAAADLAFAFPDGKKLWPPLTFTIFRSQRIALVGPNGCGKSTLLKILASHLERTGGNFQMGSLVRLGYYSQHQTDILNAENTVLGEIRRLADPHMTEEELMSVLGLFLLGQPFFDRTVSSLSGGERSRLVLASLFLKRANFLILDEPTNHLDLESREALIEALHSFDGTVLLVAHDRYFLSEVTEEAWAVSEKGITVYERGFAQYDAARLAAAESRSEKNERNQATQQSQVRILDREELKKLKREQGERRNELYKRIRPLRDRYAELEKELEALLQEQSELESKIADPETYADGYPAELIQHFEAVKADSEQMFEELSGLEEQIESLEAQRAELSVDGTVA
ncbi:MAG: ATP-binding cassette domain-containing protein [Desulfovibrionaceae bacterium]|nr:ATP-binding cassette domain-containing protein [Desulfovibrionaceae bacterium]